MENKTFFILNDDGNVERCVLTRETIDVQQSVIDRLCSSMFRTVKRAFTVQDIPVNIGLPNDCTYATLVLPKLTFKAPFKIEKESGVLYPKFSASREPVLTVDWVPPTDMKLALLVRTVDESSEVTISGNWLIAFDIERRAYRLPVGNLYEDLRLCNGDMVMSGYKTTQQAIAAVLTQMNTSEWNGDLDVRAEETQRMFRFKANNKGFEQLKHDSGNWQELCDKVAPAILKFVVL